MSSENSAAFTEAAEAAKGLKNVSQDEQLELYGLYKQATVGDVNIPQPGFLDLVSAIQLCHHVTLLPEFPTKGWGWE